VGCDLVILCDLPRLTPAFEVAGSKMMDCRACEEMQRIEDIQKSGRDRRISKMSQEFCDYFRSPKAEQHNHGMDDPESCMI
jgi:hypothetical protein